VPTSCKNKIRHLNCLLCRQRDVEADNFVSIHYRWNQLKVDVKESGSGDFWYGIRYFHYQNINLNLNVPVVSDLSRKVCN